MKYLLIATCALLMPVSVSAGELAYTCNVLQVFDLNDDGSLATINKNWEKEFIGSKFSVSRNTGEITGEVVPTLMANSTKVIHKGNKEYSFKSVAYFENQAQLIEVQEFKKGEQKPFIDMSMGGAGIVTGVCE